MSYFSSLFDNVMLLITLWFPEFRANLVQYIVGGVVLLYISFAILSRLYRDAKGLIPMVFVYLFMRALEVTFIRHSGIFY